MAPPEDDDHRKETKKQQPHKKAKKSKHKKAINVVGASNPTNSKADAQKPKLPLKGLVVSVTTLQQAQTDSTTTSQGYRDVAQHCRDLGAQVVGQVSKRVHWLIASESAVQQATQRIRKAHQKNIPIISTAWIQHILLSMETSRQINPNQVPSEYLLNEAAKKAIQQRKDQPAIEADSGKDLEGEATDPNAGWTEPISFGCSCVCHENGAEKDCPWCKSEPCAQAATTKAS
eukprot:Nitzschia sp. Nitz4//scaffold179_size51476//15319//16011//NITZ4_006923-RA/size51476-processed-gene-0.48-mRNA-1//-1//CDS//3329539207//6867//frame0